MIRLSKRTEYALLAVSYLHGRAGDPIASVNDIAGHYHLPASLLAKVMQTLKRAEFVRSVKGVAGGYSLTLDLGTVTFLDFLNIFEETTALVECLSTPAPTCLQLDCCAIRDPVDALNTLIHNQLASLTLEQLFNLNEQRSSVPAAGPL